MPGYTSVAVDAPSGVVWIEQREIDTGTVVRRFRAPDDQQPARARLEREMDDEFADWQRWKLTRAEAAARVMGAAFVNALASREDAAWASYVAALQAWRAER